VRRHARRERDLRAVSLVVGSGGVFRHAPSGEAVPAAEPVPAGQAVLARIVDDREGGWRLPRRPVCRVDHEHVLAAAGLLAAEHPAVAVALLRRAIYHW
jgi:MutL protein